jgi:hypothetical protein
VLPTQEDLNPKTLKEYASDLKQFVGWFETSEHQEEDIIFRIEDVATPTLTRYREVNSHFPADRVHNPVFPDLARHVLETIMWMMIII